MLNSQSEGIQQIIGNLSITSENIANFSQFSTSTTEDLKDIVGMLNSSLAEISEFVTTLNTNKRKYCCDFAQPERYHRQREILFTKDC